MVGVCLQSTESIDVFCFGHLLYEMTYGRPPDSVPIDQFPAVPYTAVGRYIHTHTHRLIWRSDIKTWHVKFT